MKRKILLTFALVLSMVPLYAKEKSHGTHFVPVKVGYASLQYIFSFLPETKTIESEYMSFEKQVHKQVEAKLDELHQKAMALQQGHESMTEAVRNKKQLELQQGYEQFRMESQEKIARKSASLLAPVQKKIMKAIKKVAVENGYTHVLNASVDVFSTLLYADEKQNISDLVLKELGIDPAGVKAKE